MDEIGTPMLFLYEPEQFWKQMQELIREELKNLQVSLAMRPSDTPA
jgi:hypothetical protein